MVLIRQMNALPWWSFSLVVLGFGILIKGLHWSVPGFLVGFLTGFFIWLVAGLYFNNVFNGVMIGKIGLLLGMPSIVVLVLSAVMGGLVTGLALYAGKNMIGLPTQMFWINDGLPLNC